VASLNWGHFFNDEAKTAEEINKKKLNTKEYGNWQLDLDHS
jgi:hypothetical protein